MAGIAYAGPAKLDEQTIETLRGLIPLAPIHQPRNLEIIELVASLLPDAIQVGCFDTAFHLSRPRIATLYGLPRELTESGIVSYGFHGISYGYIASKLGTRYGAQAGGRAIVAHLGSGASLCAMNDGKSVATTMGFSTLDGLVMSTRCGSLDPGVVLHLLEDRQHVQPGTTHLLYEKAGLLGVSGISGDMQTLLDSNDPGAREAVDLFVYRAGREIGSMAAATGGLDTLVFTAGIGENSAIIRERICEAAAWLGVRIDPERNRRGDTTISAQNSAVDVLVVPYRRGTGGGGTDIPRLLLEAGDAALACRVSSTLASPGCEQGRTAEGDRSAKAVRSARCRGACDDEGVDWPDASGMGRRPVAARGPGQRAGNPSRPCSTRIRRRNWSMPATPRSRLATDL